MDNDLISRTAAMNLFLEKPPEYYHTSYIVGELYCLPSVNAAPVIYARWEKDSDGTQYWWHCSNCRRVEGLASMAMNYCPGCGAKMIEHQKWQEDADRRLTQVKEEK